MWLRERGDLSGRTLPAVLTRAVRRGRRGRGGPQTVQRCVARLAARVGSAALRCRGSPQAAISCARCSQKTASPAAARARSSSARSSGRSSQRMWRVPVMAWYRSSQTLISCGQKPKNGEKVGEAFRCLLPGRSIALRRCLHHSRDAGFVARSPKKFRLFHAALTRTAEVLLRGVGETLCLQPA